MTGGLVRRDVQQLAPLELVELFEWDATALGDPNKLRWHAGTRKDGVSPIVWQGLTYEAMAIEGTGFEINSSGKLPRPTLRAANIGGLLGAYIRGIADGLGAKVTRKRTLGKYLDAVNFPGGNPNADPTTGFPDEIYYVARKVAENPVYIELELAAKFDAVGIMLPRRQVVASVCQWVYRSEECSYAGGPILNDPVYPGVDRCGKTLDSCKLRFGQFGVLRTSAFPASLLVRQQ
jgi:lambda family phage minor tail protein L